MDRALAAARAGEILLTSVDQDGTCAGPDEELWRAAEARTHVPLVLGGGCAADQLLVALQQPAVSAVSLGAACIGAAGVGCAQA